MRILVSQECIDKGKAGDSRFCPVALSLQAAGLDSPAVGPLRIWWKRHDKRVMYQDPPDSVKWFVRRFDDGETVRPFTFELVGQL